MIMKNIVNTVLNKILTLLGFSSAMLVGQSCVEYGSPHADYNINVKVTDSGNKAIPGIRVVYLPYGEDYQWGDTLYTDSSGKAEKFLGGREFYSLDAAFKVDDPDGERNGGKFKAKTVTGEDIRIVQTKKGDNNWYGGVFDISADVQLEKED